MSQVSIKDIARAARVSHPTVSRALRGDPLVNRQTAEHIRRIADRMGYRPSAVARSLVTRKTKIIGVVVTTVTDPFVGEVVEGIEFAANARGYSPVLANSNADPEREQQIVHSFHEQRVDGIIVTSSRVGALHAPQLSQLAVPIVLINNQHDGQFTHSVMIDNVPASRAAVAHLVELGHRRIAYLGDQFGFQSETERLAGYRQALAQARIRFQRQLVAQGDGKAEGGRLAMAKLLALAEPPTAVFCYNDMSALGAMRAIRAHGLIVPADISIVGFDDLFLSSYTNPMLTTVRQPKRQMGEQAMESLFQLLGGKKARSLIRVKGELIVRESTAPPKKRK